MSKLTRNQKILIAVVLLAFAAVKVVSLLWWQGQQPDITPVSEAACNVRTGCRLPNGATVKFSENVSAKAPFDIVVRDVGPSVPEVFVSFSMSNMDMGFNRYKLVRQEDGTWAANQIRLPVCTQNRNDYLADIHIGNEVFQTAFTAE
ncbi:MULTISPECIES: hypothetical protein [unclassified Neisseria]|uniref:hypothetical protein n=1 Tax=unclassified Neisseria TaxID=2623750 RepID=UPI0026654CF4|nr:MULTISPECIES: hypothetical protein [unclassified Neisseria]MDO1510597.1 hypothetical protein [Neisseria sp. MVDL19-042950]MDO1516279.1 hypothetical protein [Neisseria sp. MVDL18-041461]MDO1564249.1 hypothetical protein [Neisseria sp. MVDL20-010259]